MFCRVVLILLIILLPGALAADDPVTRFDNAATLVTHSAGDVPNQNQRTHMLANAAANGLDRAKQPNLPANAAANAASQPNLSTIGDDPWKLAKQLGIAGNESYPLPPELEGVDLFRQSDEAVIFKSQSCIECHGAVGNMHLTKTVKLGCTDCHGGNAQCFERETAHVQAQFTPVWASSANPVRSYTLLNHERPEFVRFVNPGDLRIAHISCGQCHANEVLQLRKSMMTHGAMLWGAALYNNGSVHNKWARYGESYSMHGISQRLQNVPAPTHEEVSKHGLIPFLDPLPQFEITQPGNILRIFERSSRFRPETGIPERLEEPGRPRERLSNRGLGTENRTDPVFISLQKTRLFDPTLNFLGTNDHPGDYRSSGCSACHVLYANDRSPIASGFIARYGNEGQAAAHRDDWVQQVDPTIPKYQSGHPIQHQFSLRIPTSQCIVCHVHPGTNVLNSYLGYMWWDNETEGKWMYPPKQKEPTAEEYMAVTMSNPDEAAARGNWGDPEFLKNVVELNPVLEHTQFADFHGHGWVYRAVFKKDRHGNLLDYRGQKLDNISNEQLMSAVRPASREEQQVGKHREQTPVHLMDIHMEKGMHCTDCHFYQDVHGNTKLYGEVRAAIEITCIDCHGTATKTVIESIQEKLASAQPLRRPTSGPAASKNGTDLLALRTPFGQPRFEIVRNPGESPKLIQRSTVEPDQQWEVKQTADTVRPGNKDYNPRSHIAKSVRMESDGGLTWGGTSPQDFQQCPHQESNMNCIACHSSWNASCFGCHLPQKANIKSPLLHANGEITRNRVSYNFQTLRDDVFMLARDGNVTGNRIGPARSSCAIHVSSFNANRESIYIQQQTISSDGQSGIAFSTNVPHTVRGGTPRHLDSEHQPPGTFETKSCTDCHISKTDDNNAILTQLLMQGTGYTNFIGKYCWVAAGEHGLHGVVVTESSEPQAVIGSTLHRDAYPNHFRDHVQRSRQLEHSHEHSARDVFETLTFRARKTEILDLQQRGEYLYAACGEGGLRIFDTAFIDNKGFSERITTAPVSPLGQRFYVRTEYATSVTAPATIAPDPTRKQSAENQEQSIHPLYGYIFVTDKCEGLILVGAATLLDGNPLNNFLERALTFNPDGILNGATAMTLAGHIAYVCCDAGLVVVNLDEPLKPQVVAVLGNNAIQRPTSIAVQFRYALVCDAEGVKVLDITYPMSPILVQRVAVPEAHRIYLARTYAYVAAGSHGLAILDITRPAATSIDQFYDAQGTICDAHDVQLGITNVSQFAYVADGKNGLRVIQLTSPDTPGNDGFSPRPTPCLVATYKLPKNGHALAISRGIDRDRAVDESGHQIAVFGRVGARPLNQAEVQRMFFRPDGLPYTTSDDPWDRSQYRIPETLWNSIYNPEHSRRSQTSPF